MGIAKPAAPEVGYFKVVFDATAFRPGDEAKRDAPCARVSTRVFSDLEAARRFALALPVSCRLVSWAGGELKEIARWKR